TGSRHFVSPNYATVIPAALLCSWQYYMPESSIRPSPSRAAFVADWADYEAVSLKGHNVSHNQDRIPQNNADFEWPRNCASCQKGCGVPCGVASLDEPFPAAAGGGGSFWIALSASTPSAFLLVADEIA